MINVKGKWALITGAKNGRTFAAQDFRGLSLEEAVELAQQQPAVY